MKSRLAAYLDDWALQQALKGVEKLEAAVHRRAIVERERDHSAKAALELLDRASELIEIIVELLGADVHNIVRHTFECVNRRLEIRVDLLH